MAVTPDGTAHAAWSGGTGVYHSVSHDHWALRGAHLTAEPGRTLTIEGQTNVSERMPHLDLMYPQFEFTFRDGALATPLISLKACCVRGRTGMRTRLVRSSSSGFLRTCRNRVLTWSYP